MIRRGRRSSPSTSLRKGKFVKIKVCQINFIYLYLNFVRLGLFVFAIHLGRSTFGFANVIKLEEKNGRTCFETVWKPLTASWTGIKRNIK